MPDVLDAPFSPVHSARKFSAVLGTTSPNRPNTMRPAGAPLISMSKNTLLVTAGSAARATPMRQANSSAKIFIIWLCDSCGGCGI